MKTSNSPQPGRSQPSFFQIGPFFRSDVNRRNFWLGVANGVLYAGADALTDPSLVLTYFTSLLTTSKFLVGLVAPIRIGGWFLPQLLVSGFVQRQERKLLLYAQLGILRSLAWALMVVALWFIRDPALLLGIFLGFLVLYSLAEGVAGLSFMDVVAKVVPLHRRGAFFGARRLLGGLLALAASAVVGWVLSETSGIVFPHNFALLFGLSFVCISLALYAFARIDEPLEPVTHERVGVSAQLQRAGRLPRQNPTYARFLSARLLMVVADMTVPFYVVFAKEALHAPPGLVGVYLATTTLSALLSNLWAARTSDRRGNRQLLVVACLAGLVSPAIALSFGWWGGPALLFSIVFAVNGVYNTAAWVAHFNFLLEISPPGDRPIYVGTANTLVGVAILASSGGGALVDWLGFEALFSLALVALLLATVITLSIREPRSGRLEADQPGEQG
ncbi:MAG: MFS transporter [Anaerolineae bacterium]